MPANETPNPYAAPECPLGPGQRFIRIVATPPGEAPEEIRRAWVGLTLPLAPGFFGRRAIRGFGVLTAPRSFFGLWFARITGKAKVNLGYAVKGRTAVAILGMKAPEAADWWRSNVPQALEPGRILVFSAEACQELP